MIRVSEVFGPTIQGEGPHAGRRVWFVRTGLCNLSCSWCDTPYTWDETRFDVKADNPLTEPDVVWDWLLARGADEGDRVVLSGGEPLMWASQLPDYLHPRWRWHVETNGTRPPPPWWLARIEHTSVSPKINTDDPVSKRLRWPVLEEWAEHAHNGAAVFKFVATDPTIDIERIEAVVGRLGLCADEVWVMPEGTTPERVLAGMGDLAGPVLEHGWNLSSRLHTLMWGEERGR